MSLTLKQKTSAKTNIIDLRSLYSKSVAELLELEKNLSIKSSLKNCNKMQIIKSIVDYYVTNNYLLISSGYVEIINGKKFGFLRSSANNYSPRDDDIYINGNLINANQLDYGDYIIGEIKLNKDDKSANFYLTNIKSINNHKPDNTKNSPRFDNLVPNYPTSKLNLSDQITGRTIEILAPIGKGQRSLIVAPPKSGKTTILQEIALSVIKNHSEVHLIFLMIGERPEEGTETTKLLLNNSHSNGYVKDNVEIFSSTFDQSAHLQICLADMILARSKKLACQGKDVVLILDSLTRLTRAYNEVSPVSGKTMSGGVEYYALAKAKKFFGAARKLDNGSLTIIASVLVDTSSKMDSLIFEEFKGTGNMELYLSRRAAEKYIFPAIHISKSGTRREDLLLDPNDLRKIILLKRLLNDMDEVEGIDFLLKKMKNFKNNEDFFNNMQQT